MISRENYAIVKEYLAFLKAEKQLDEATVKVAWVACRLLLEYADIRPLFELSGSRPTLPEHLMTIKGKLTGTFLTARYQVKMLENIRHFYTWARMYKRGVWAKVPEAWIDNLRVKRSYINSGKERKDHVFWDLEGVLKVASYKPGTLRFERMQAAICFMFLSGMRVTAFCSLPVDCVDIEAGRIEQKPSRGVITKNRKSAVTFLLPIPELLEVVTAWDKKIRAAGARFWFAPFETFTEDDDIAKISSKAPKTFSGRRGLFDGDLRDFCKAVGVPVLSAHKLRHGHGVYGVRNAKTIEDLKAISQNLMHANLGITDGIYGVLPEENIKRVISAFGTKPQPKQETPATQPENGQDLPANFVQFARMLFEQMKK